MGWVIYLHLFVIVVGDELPVGASEQAIEPHCQREGLLEVRGNGLQPRLGLADGQAHRQRRLVLQPLLQLQLDEELFC